jgi:hypothetical protein
MGATVDKKNARKKTTQKPLRTLMSGFYRPGDLVEAVYGKIFYKGKFYLPKDLGFGIVVREQSNEHDKKEGEDIYPFVKVFWQNPQIDTVMHKKNVKRATVVEEQNRIKSS